MAIDLSAMTPEQIHALEMTGFIHQIKANGMPEKPKRKQQGRGENQLERDFEANIRAKPWLKFWSKPFILRIGAGRTFEPDAMVLDHDHTWVIDTKGPWTDGDSRLKICMAASQYSHWRWLIVTRPDGTWKAKEVSPLKGIGRKFIQLPWLN